MYTDNMKFVDTHEWVILKSDNIAEVGITFHAQELLGDLVYIELPKVGSHVKINDVVGVVESVKAASDLYSPISGEVIAINDEVVSDPTLANTDPHGKGWLIKVKLSTLDEYDALLSATDYKKLIGG